MLNKKYAVLFFIYEKKKTNYEELKNNSEKLNVSEKYIYRVCDLLKNEQLIKIDYNKNIYITKKGQDLVEELINNTIKLRLYDNFHKKIKFIILLCTTLSIICIYNLYIYISLLITILSTYVITNIIK